VDIDKEGTGLRSRDRQIPIRAGPAIISYLQWPIRIRWTEDSLVGAALAPMNVPRMRSTRHRISDVDVRARSIRVLGVRPHPGRAAKFYDAAQLGWGRQGPVPSGRNRLGVGIDLDCLPPTT
jgi:hypothetical protein